MKSTNANAKAELPPIDSILSLEEITAFIDRFFKVHPDDYLELSADRRFYTGYKANAEAQELRAKNEYATQLLCKLRQINTELTGSKELAKTPLTFEEIKYLKNKRTNIYNELTLLFSNIEDNANSSTNYLQELTPFCKMDAPTCHPVEEMEKSVREIIGRFYDEHEPRAMAGEKEPPEVHELFKFIDCFEADLSRLYYDEFAAGSVPVYWQKLLEWLGEWRKMNNEEIYGNTTKSTKTAAEDEALSPDPVAAANHTPTASTPAPPTQLPPRFAADHVFCRVLYLAEQAGIIERDGNRYRPGNIKGARVTDADICFLIARHFCGDRIVGTTSKYKKDEYVKGDSGNFPGKETAELFGGNARKWARPRLKFPATPPRLRETIEKIYRQAESSL